MCSMYLLHYFCKDIRNSTSVYRQAKMHMHIKASLCKAGINSSETGDSMRVEFVI